MRTAKAAQFLPRVTTVTSNHTIIIDETRGEHSIKSIYLNWAASMPDAGRRVEPPSFKMDADPSTLLALAPHVEFSSCPRPSAYRSWDVLLCRLRPDEPLHSHLGRWPGRIQSRGTQPPRERSRSRRMPRGTWGVASICPTRRRRFKVFVPSAERNGESRCVRISGNVTKAAACEWVIGELSPESFISSASVRSCDVPTTLDCLWCRETPRG